MAARRTTGTVRAMHPCSSRRSRLLPALALVAATSALAAGPAQAETENRAVGTRYGGYGLTNFDLTKLVADGSFTLTARYVAKYPYMHAGAILGARSSARMFQVGIGDFRYFQPNSGFGSWNKNGKLQVRIGDRQLVYRLGDDTGGAAAKWKHLAVVVTRAPGGDGKVRLYLDGSPKTTGVCIVTPPDENTQPSLCPGFSPDVEVTVPAAQFAGIGGALMLGQTGGGAAAAPPPIRRVPDQDSPDIRPGYVSSVPSDDQFYGLIDDIGVFTSALTAEQVAKLAAARRLSGYELGLRLGFNYDVGDPAPPRGRRAPRLGKTKFVSGRSTLLKVGKSRSGVSFDTIVALTKLRPVQSVPWTLPFDRGQEWLVLWGNNTPNSSHNGYASFSWDFVLNAKPNPQTCGTNLRAPAPGGAIFIDDDGVSDRPDLHQDATNEITGRVTPTEHFGFLHIQTNSVRQTFTTAAVPPAVPFGRGQVIARTGNRNLDVSNCHLHMSSKANGAATTPAEFRNYEVKDPKTGQWKFFSVGVPRTGQIIRNPPVK